MFAWFGPAFGWLQRACLLVGRQDHIHGEQRDPGMERNLDWKWEQYWYSSRHGAEATVLYFSDKLFVDLTMYLGDGATGDVGTDTLERVYDGELKSLQSEVESEEMEW